MRLKFILAAISLSIFLLTTSLFAQSDSGRISGTVSDVNGAVIPGASVKTTDDVTGETRTVQTKADGSFLVLALKPSKYTITSDATNFATVVKKDVGLLVGQQLNLDIQLPAKGVDVQID